MVVILWLLYETEVPEQRFSSCCSPTRLAFWRQFEPDKLVAAFPCRIDQLSPAPFLSRADVVFLDIAQEWVRYVLIKQNAQIAGSRRTVSRP